MRVAAAVYEAMKPILNEMSQKIDNKLDSIRDDLIQNLTEQIINYAGYTYGGTGGWRHAIYLNMTDFDTNCPSGYNILEYDWILQENLR